MASYQLSPSVLNSLDNMQNGNGNFAEHSLPKADNNPFSDIFEKSRTTASGFTDYDHLKEELEFLKTQMPSLESMKQDMAHQESFKELEDEEMGRKLAILNRKMEIVNQGLQAMNDKKQDQSEKTMDDAINDLETVLSASTIKPNDSASLIKPTKKTNLTTYSSIRSSFIRGSEHDDVVGGFGVTTEDRIAEQNAIQNIQTVYGLPRIFIDNRLNFLIHLHKPLQAMLTSGTGSSATYPDPNSLEKLTRFIDKARGRHREPHAELLYQVLRATIDLRRMKVHANPFNLPIIEIGMNLDDQLVYMCISELYSEFCTLWFHSMKNVEPPAFANKYRTMKHPSPSPPRANQRRRKSRTSSSSLIGSILSA